MSVYNKTFVRFVASSLIVAISCLLTSCGSVRSSSVSGQSLFSSKNILSFAVWLEDQCEIPEEDARTTTVAEALHDGIVVSASMLFAVGTVTAVSTVWSLYDRITLPPSEPLPNRPELIVAYLMPRRAAPIHQESSNRLILLSGCFPTGDEQKE